MVSQSAQKRRNNSGSSSIRRGEGGVRPMTMDLSVDSAVGIDDEDSVDADVRFCGRRLRTVNMC